MKKLLLLTALCVLLLGVAPAHALIPANYAPTGPGDVYLALGDSLVTGSNGQGEANRTTSYPERLYTQLLRHYPKLTRTLIGRDGETSGTLVTGGQLAQAEAFILSERAAGRRVGLVTLSIGGNDMAAVLLNGADPQTTISQFRTNLGMALDRLLAALTVNGVRQGDLLIIDYYNPYPGFTMTTPPFYLADIWIPQLNTIIKEAAAARSLPVAEVAAGFSGREALQIFVDRARCQALDTPFVTCDYHPTNAGQQAIADRLAVVSGYVLPQAFLPMARNP